MYTYRAKVISVYDGDTVTLEVDLGFNVKIKEKFRLLGINAPEVRGKEKVEGKKSRDYLRAFLKGREVHVATMKDRKGKYGRYLATLVAWIPDSEAAGMPLATSDVMLTKGEKHFGVNVNEWLVQYGYAEKRDY